MGYWWERVVLPVRRVWLGVASRFGVRQTGKRRRLRLSPAVIRSVAVGGAAQGWNRLTPAAPVALLGLQGCGGCGRR